MAATAKEANASAPVARRVALQQPVAMPHHAVAADEVLLGAPGASTDVKLLDESTDPFGGGDVATSTTDGGDLALTPTTQPSEGRSVSSSEVSVSDSGTVEIHVNDANLVEVLRMLSLQSQKNIIASKDVRGTITANLYDVTVREALDAILHANGYAYREKGNFIYVYTTKEIQEIERAERQMRTEVFRVFYTPAINAANMIKPVLSKTGGEVAVTTPSKAGIGSAPAGGGGNDHAGEDVLVVTDYPENLDAVRRILAEIDRRPQQILLEATILRATLNEDNALGVDFNILGGVDFNTIQIGENTGQITGRGVEPTPAAPGAADQRALVQHDRRAHSVGTGNSFTSPIQGGLKVGFISQNVSMFLAALEQTTDTTVLANPKILALNRQQGEVFVGNEDGYYTTITTETTTSQSVESLKTGTRLIFRPYIASDGYIRMEVHPEDSDGQVKANGLPSKTTTEVTSNVMVKDGHTIVIGGLFRESSVSGRNQIPFLGNLPIAGHLFRNQRDRTVREEVIILLTPHIVKDDAAYSRLSIEELKRSEDLRVGVRRGMMPWGRERLAEGWYEAAKRELAKPNPDRKLAKWHLDCATNLNPTFAEAIELREQITGHEVTAVYGSSVRHFIRRAIITDLAPATQPAVETAVDDLLKDEPALSEVLLGLPTTQPVDLTADADLDVTITSEEEQAMVEEEESSDDVAMEETWDDVAMDEAMDEAFDDVTTMTEESGDSSEFTSTSELLEEEPQSMIDGEFDVATEDYDGDVTVTVTPLEE